MVTQATTIAQVFAPDGEVKTYRVWQLVLGLDRGISIFVLSVALLLYNVGRGFLTRVVGPLRDAEERSGTSPDYSAYRWFWPIHVSVCVLLIVAVITGGYHVCHMLSQLVLIPG